jgi:hypothetical protein
MAETFRANTNAVAAGQLHFRAALWGANVQCAVFHLNLRHAIQIAHGKVAALGAHAHAASKDFQRLALSRRHLEEGFTLQQFGDFVLSGDIAGERRIGVEQDLGTIGQLQTLTFAHHGQMIGLDAQAKVAEGEDTQHEHCRRRQWQPVRAQVAQQVRFGFGRGHCSGHLGNGLGMPDGLNPGESFPVRAIGRQPFLKARLLLGVGAVQFDEPVQGLIHRAVAQHILGNGMGAMEVRVLHERSSAVLIGWQIIAVFSAV